MSLISWLQSPSAVIFEPRKIKSATVSTVSPSIFHEVTGPDAMILPHLTTKKQSKSHPQDISWVYPRQGHSSFQNSPNKSPYKSGAACHWPWLTFLGMNVTQRS